ncbi:cellulose synthase/poly-beta-1,6-N-acetylglucosamine synthase-like glycosyltransferase [Anoxybacillus voinovskiensis]|uniref:Cellulose synthase/poly-beta-1,6-N-acetylglucosamine synthase-like glycosyltransferase n=1 Tax=Anoxybacteroides voinovskiense TaxID=230470 RepID=A0A840DNU9_9BACL|nr:glycosyltransferase [Anoxybacillus voinovskiensis]MBB4074871.1 cellulose synthase/poly-beta-1,6-N-acetylglucosamine synthase-like glycosyltransferase [Anoxybacillus voinovskiensis]GGJ74663.1 glycosyl transferase [Anoxybacillus voinovskiensis]
MGIDIWYTFVSVVGWFVFLFMVAVIAFYTFLLLVSLVQLRKSYQLDEWEPYEELLDVSYAKPLSILVPAYNESAGIFGTVRSLLSIEYPEYEIIVINDGSTDDTLAKLIESFQLVRINHVIRQQLKTKRVKAVYRSKLYRHLFVIDKENGGKADALNAGINVSRYPYFCSIDGDSVLERSAFLKVMKPIIDSDGEVIASGGSIRIANGCEIESGEIVKVGLSRHPLVVMQVIEYLRAFLMGRIGLSRHNLLLIVSGAFGVFSKRWVIEAGGYAHTVGEDMELVVRLHRLIKERKESKKIVYVPDPVCWTEAPESLKYLRRQRSRWHRGLLESLWIHRRLIFNPKYGSIGLVSMPYFLFIEFFGPVVELLGYVVMLVSLFFGGVYIEFAILLFLLSVIYGSVFSMAAVLLEEWTVRKFPNVSDIVRLFLFSLTESLWYRPLTVWWRCEGIVDVLRKKRGWGEMTRKGVSK